MSSKKIQTLRGVSADVVYCEEMAYMDFGVMYEVVVPLMEMRNAILIGISTPVDTFSFFHSLLELKNGDQHVFNVYKCQLVCDMCLQLDFLDCPHNKHLIPPWKSEEKHQIVKLIIGSNLEILKRESLYVSFLFCFFFLKSMSLLMG